MADSSPRRELISNIGNLRGESCHRSYSLQKMDLSVLISNSGLAREWVVYWCMLLPLSLIFSSSLSVSLFSLFPYLFSLFSFFSSLFSVFLHCCLLCMSIAFYTTCCDKIYHFYPLNTFGLLWVSFQKCPLVYRLPNHHHYTMLAVSCLIPRQKQFLFCFLIPFALSSG